MNMTDKSLTQYTCGWVFFLSMKFATSILTSLTEWLNSSSFLAIELLFQLQSLWSSKRQRKHCFSKYRFAVFSLFVVMRLCSFWAHSTIQKYSRVFNKKLLFPLEKCYSLFLPLSLCLSSLLSLSLSLYLLSLSLFFLSLSSFSLSLLSLSLSLSLSCESSINWLFFTLWLSFIFNISFFIHFGHFHHIAFVISLVESFFLWFTCLVFL